MGSNGAKRIQALQEHYALRDLDIGSFMQEDRCQARADVGTNMALLRSVVSQMKAREKNETNTQAEVYDAAMRTTLWNLLCNPIGCKHEKRIE